MAIIIIDTLHTAIAWNVEEQTRRAGANTLITPTPEIALGPLTK